MASSDSEDDCYGNVAKKLQTLKNKIQEKPNEVKSDLSKGAQNIPTNFVDTSSVVLEDGNTTINSTDNEELTLDAIIAKNAKPKRGRKRKSAEDSFEPIYERQTRSKRKSANSTRGKGKKGRGGAATDNVETPGTSEPPKSGRRGRKSVTNQTIDSLLSFDSTSIISRGARSAASSRGNTRRTRGRQNRNTLSNIMMSAYPIYSVGNTDEYPDMCDNQALFSTNTNEVEIIENDPLDTGNEELSVKVYWQNDDVVRFNIRKYQKLTPIFKYFAEKENIANDKLLFMYNDRILKVDDTPDSINYSIAKFIDGGIVNQDITDLVKQNNTDQDGLLLKFQCQNVKKPFEVTIPKDQRFILAMTKCAEHIEIPLERLKFYFDGDLLSSKSTPQELELEGGECIDVKFFFKSS